ncbi:MAG TPA: hypothetical protein VMU72_10820 [Gaiellaceae bacterium]|nr:hypothetical protein [Gaiellaceae bacterium]
MKRITLALAVLVPLAFVAVARADTTVPFPSNQVKGVFVAAQTVTKAGAISDQFAPGDTVVFRAFAVNTKTHKLLTKKFGRITRHNAKLAKKSLRSFFVRIPLVGDRQFIVRAAPKGLDPRYRWAISWKVPALYPLGVVQFQVFARMWNKQRGTFAQLPIAASQLTITATPQEPYGPGPTEQGSVTSSNLDVVLYGDAVAGHSRPVACTQTNVFKVGEQVIVRDFGYQLSDGAVLSMDNVTDAHFSVPGQPDTVLNWGSHGPSGPPAQKVWYWTGAWTIPADYPLGDIDIHVTFKTVAGKTGTLDYPITIIPSS